MDAVFPSRLVKKGRFLTAVVLEPLWAESGIFEDQGKAIAERDFGWLPSGTLVILSGIIPYRLPFLVEPFQVRLVVGDPFLDGLPRWLDGLHGVDIEGRRWAGKMDDTFPEAVEAEEEFDFLGAEEGSDGFHDALTAGALERVATPDFEDEVAPEGAHVAGSAFRRCGDEEDLGGCWRFGGRLWLLLGRGDGGEAVKRGETTGFVGIDAVVADSLLALGREVVDGGGDKVGGFENLEVALGVVVAFGAVDDGFGGGVPGDFLEGERVTEEVLGEAFSACGVVGGYDFLAPVVDVEAGMFPREQVGKSLGANESGITQGVEEAVAEEFDGGSKVFGGHTVESAVGGEESIGG